MKAAGANILFISVAVVLTAVSALAHRAGKKELDSITCNALQVNVTDSASWKFIDESNVKEFMEEYGTYIGQRLDSVDLKKIENMLGNHSALSGCEAYLTSDGVLHLEVTQRRPVVRLLKNGTGFYADGDGYLFPLHPHYSPDVPTVTGNIPVSYSDGFKGRPEDESEREWLGKVISMVQYVSSDKKALDAPISSIAVDGRGNLTVKLTPDGESFILGSADGLPGKFRKIREYMEVIAPQAPEKGYKVVDLRYDRQIICK